MDDAEALDAYPKNRNQCSGGSSGGEGALIGLKGSPVGLGTDIGGSIRIPAGFNGLFAIRPSAGRLPYEGMANSMDGQISVLSVVGPIGTTAGAVKPVVRSLLSQSPWLYDPMVVDMPWRDAEEQAVYDLVKGKGKGRLSFGLMKGDGVVNPQPPVLRAVQLVAAALEKAGHVIIEWKPPSHKLILDAVFKTWVFDGGIDVHKTFGLSGETPSPQITMTYGVEPRQEATASQIAATNVQLRRLRKQYLDYWNGTESQTGTGRPVDGVIGPLAPFPAARPLGFKYYGLSAWVNALD